jgi:hypothetical protein
MTVATIIYLYYYHIIIIHLNIKLDLLRKMNTAKTFAIVAIMAALAFVAAGNFAIMKVFAQRNPIPSPDSQAYYHACVYQEPGGTEAAFCYPP